MPTKKMMRVLITLHGEKSKAFTSEGPLVTGSIVELPAAEAERLIAAGNAHLTEDVEHRIEPETNIDSGEPEPVDPG